MYQATFVKGNFGKTRKTTFHFFLFNLMDPALVCKDEWVKKKIIIIRIQMMENIVSIYKTISVSLKFISI